MCIDTYDIHVYLSVFIVCLCVSVCACRVCVYVCVCQCVCVSVCAYRVCVCQCVCRMCACVCECVLPSAYSGVYYASVCKLEDQMGTQIYVQWSNCMDTMHAQRTHPMRIQCWYKGSIYGNTMHVQRANPMGHDVHMHIQPILWDSACSYTFLHVCTVSQWRALCHV